MGFSVVDLGYDRAEVDSCLVELAYWSARLVDRVPESARIDSDLSQVREVVARLDDLLAGAVPPGRDVVGTGQVAEPLARARAEVTAAREEARQIRDQAYADAVQARRDFEAALYARRIREERVDRMLRGLLATGQPAPGDPAAATPEQAPRMDGRAGATVA